MSPTPFQRGQSDHEADVDPMALRLAEMDAANAELIAATRALVEEPGLLAIPDDVFTRLSRKGTRQTGETNLNLTGA